MQVFVTDFDGVICNSINECYITLCAAYYQYRNINALDDAGFKKYFYAYRCFVRDPAEFLILAESYYQDGLKKIEKKTYKSYLAILKSKFDHFRKLFFTQRENLKEDENKWLSLHSPYSGYIKLLNEIETPKYIVTTKDVDSVRKILKYFGLSLTFKGLYTQEDLRVIGSKFRALQNIIKLEREPPEQVVYIDDHIDYLKELEPLKIQLFFARWGYADNEQDNCMPSSVINPIHLHELGETFKEVS